MIAHAALTQALKDLEDFVEQEQKANFGRRNAIWQQPIDKKLERGDSQVIADIEVVDRTTLALTLGEGDSRFREGDMVCLHTGDVLNSCFLSQASIEAQYDNQWLVRAQELDVDALRAKEGPFYADPDAMDLTDIFNLALEDLAKSVNGTDTVLPLLAGTLPSNGIFPEDYDRAADYAEQQGLNEEQVDAVAVGVAAQYIACIQGPPGTGKTKVISLIAKLLLAERQRVLVTSHNHMAINNALNKIAEAGCFAIKVGAPNAIKGLDTGIMSYPTAEECENLPAEGYVIGATPYATCSKRLKDYDFDTVIVDEASQVTMPLAVMAMRKAKRYVFVGDQQQLPPVLMSKSVLNSHNYSAFAKLVEGNKETSVMLRQTYRMNQTLTHYPSKAFYRGELTATGPNQQRRFCLAKTPQRFPDVLSGANSLVFIPSPGLYCGTTNPQEAELVAALVQDAHNAGLALDEVGIVTPFRRQAGAIRSALEARFTATECRSIIADTVERMQGQERELVIISFCATDRDFINKVANFFFQRQRLNVSITRAKTKLVLLAPKLTLEDFAPSVRSKRGDEIELFQALIAHAKHCELY